MFSALGTAPAVKPVVGFNWFFDQLLLLFNIFKDLKQVILFSGSEQTRFSSSFQDREKEKLTGGGAINCEQNQYRVLQNHNKEYNCIWNTQI